MTSPRLMIALLATCIGVAACSADTSETDQGIGAPAPSVSIEETVEVVVDEGNVTVVSAPIETAYEPQLGYYALSFDLESASGQPNKEYNETSPAMPFIADGLAVYLEGNSYKFQFRHANGTSSEVIAGNATDWTSVRLVNLPAGATLFVDGTSVLTGSRVRPMVKSTVGKGYRNRVWTGRIRDLQACSVGDSLSTADIAGLTCGDTK